MSPTTPGLRMSDVPKAHRKALLSVEAYLRKMKSMGRQVAEVKLFRKDWQAIENAIQPEKSLARNAFMGSMLTFGVEE